MLQFLLRQSFWNAMPLQQAWRMTMRDWRAGELRFLVLALMLAVAALSAVGFFVDRMQGALTRDASQLLGADLILRSSHPVNARWHFEAARRGLRTADTISFPSMATTGKGASEDARLVAVKAVSAGYPLRGAVTLSFNGKEQLAQSTPARGSVWVDAAFLAARNVRQGDVVQLGSQNFVIAATILREQDRGAGFMNFAPRVMLAAEDLPATGLVQNGSRLSYRLLVAGEAAQVTRFQFWLESQIKTANLRGMQIETLETGNPEMRATLDRARQFLALVGMLTAMLAALAIALAARRFMQRHLDACAMLRCLGLTQNQLTLLYLIEFSLVGLAASLAGVAIGFGAHFMLLYWLGPLMDVSLPAASWLPVAQGIAAGMLLLLGFALPPVLQLRNVPHNRVLRREQEAPRAFTLAGYLLALGNFVALLVWQAGELKLGLLTAAGFLVGLAVFSLLAILLLKSLHCLRAPLNFPAWVFALTSLKRRPAASVLQMVALALGLMALLLLTVIRQDMLAAWRHASPVDAPDHFIINIQPEQKDAVLIQLRQSGISEPRLYPMIRGRLLQIDGREVSANSFDDDRARRMVEREFNLSTMAELPAQNKIIDGQWFGANGSMPEASVEQGLAKTLGLKLGDTLRFDVAGQPLEARITSLRKLDWGSMRVNFFVILNPSAVQALPRSWITAFRLPAQQQMLVNQLMHAYPNLTIVDVGSMLAQIQQVIDQVVAAVEFLFGFTLAAGVLVLVAAMLGSQQERLREAGILRALGATRRQLSRAQTLECLLLGAVAGAMAASGAALTGWVLARFVFDFVWSFSPLLWVFGIAAGAGCALVGGWAGLRTVLTQAPLQTLREA
jgi:putative ABC transport system permease protein